MKDCFTASFTNIGFEFETVEKVKILPKIVIASSEGAWQSRWDCFAALILAITAKVKGGQRPQFRKITREKRIYLDKLLKDIEEGEDDGA